MTNKPKAPTYVALAIFCLIFIVPVYWILLSAFLPSHQLLSDPPTYFTTEPTTANIQRTIDQVPLWQYFRNSVVFATGASALTVMVAFFSAYAFARWSFRGSRAILIALIMSMALPQIATTIPLFALFNRLGLVNSIWGLVIVQASLLAPFTVWTMVTFVRQIPVDIEAAARVDAANFWQTMWLVVLPLARPGLVTLFLVNFITTWNELFYPLVFATTDSVRPLTIGLIQLTQVNSGVGSRPWDLMATLSATMIVPILLLVAVGQRRIVAGLTAGALK